MKTNHFNGILSILILTTQNVVSISCHSVSLWVFFSRDPDLNMWEILLNNNMLYNKTILGISKYVSSVSLRLGNTKPNYFDLLRHTCSDYKPCATYSNFQ